MAAFHSPDPSALPNSVPSSEERADVCATCRFWVRWGSERGGCHRLPPMTDFNVTGREAMYQRIEITITKSHNPIWPNTAEDDWCGEHRTAERSDEGTSAASGRQISSEQTNKNSNPEGQ